MMQHLSPYLHKTKYTMSHDYLQDKTLPIKYNLDVFKQYHT